MFRYGVREWKQWEVEMDSADAGGERAGGVLRDRSGTFVVPQRLRPVFPRQRYTAAEEDERRAMDTAAHLPFLRRHHVPRAASARDDLREGNNDVLNGLETHGMIVEYDLRRYQSSPWHVKFELKIQKLDTKKRQMKQGEASRRESNVEEKSSRE
ncbi:hypothetical protein B0H14DRAFT_2627849 [Mycena olivaceomarginata]|nr:hypothetical protein B0H14DRAFT_2627849 [Mycena olivaceomarginata]